MHKLIGDAFENMLSIICFHSMIGQNIKNIPKNYFFANITMILQNAQGIGFI